MKKVLKIILALVLTAGLMVWCFRQIQWPILLHTFSRARVIYLIPAFTVSLSLIALNAIQWKIFLPRFGRVSFLKMFELISVFSMTVNVVPFWGGHALMIYLLGQREKVGKTVALSAVTLDQIVEGPAKLSLFGIVFLLGPFPEWMKQGMQGFFLLVIVVYLILMTLAFRYREKPQENLAPSANLSGKLKCLVMHWAHHLHVLRHWPRLVLTVLLAMGMKFLEVAAVYLIQKSLGVPLGWSAAFLVTAAISLATTVPLTPGRLGIFEAAAMLAYQYLSIPATTALALGIVIHAAHTLPFIVAGYLSSVRMGLTFGEERRAEALLAQAEA